jgi:hypothetical protein
VGTQRKQERNTMKIRKQEQTKSTKKTGKFRGKANKESENKSENRKAKTREANQRGKHE